MLAATFDIEDDLSLTNDNTADLEQLRLDCLSRAKLYRVLAGVFVEEPSQFFVEALRQPDFVASLQALGITFEADFLSPEIPALTETLACEYATLFASSGGFPPIESVRLTGRFKQEPHFQIALLYKRLGFEQTRGRFDVFADQLGMELMFVAELLERSAGVLADGELVLYKQLDKEIKRFWSLHLGRWVRGYSGLIQRAANHSFYRGMASFLGGFATEEILAMGLRKLEDLDQGQLVVPKSEITLEFNPDEPVCGECPSGLTDRMEAPGKLRVIPINAVQDLAF